MYQEIPLTQIVPNPHNSRTTFKGNEFDELVKSIASLGVIEPIIVRPIKRKGDAPLAGKGCVDTPVAPGSSQGCPRSNLDGHPPSTCFEIVAGERRFRACLEVNKGNDKGAVIPALVRDLSDLEAIEFMTVENLQRKNLNELEEARAFQTYLTFKGADAAEDLASKIGVDPRYIRRRVRVLDLPDKALKMWSDGHLRYGHLEQLLRLGGKQEVLDFLSRGTISSVYSVADTRRDIDNRSPQLSWAKFQTEKAGCKKCLHNTGTQARLFGDDYKTYKLLCTLPACFRKHQEAAIKKTWDPALHGTPSFAWLDTLRYDDYAEFCKYSPAQHPKCAACDKFVTLLNRDGKVRYEHACLQKSCFNALDRTRKSTGMPKSGQPASWDGVYFREEFYKSAIPKIAEPISPDSPALLHATLVAILQENSHARAAFDAQISSKVNDGSSHVVGYLWPRIESLSEGETKEAIKSATLDIILQGTPSEGTNRYSNGEHLSPGMRHTIAAHLGIDLQRDWILNEEYLKKKTVAEILKIGRMSALASIDRGNIKRGHSSENSRDVWGVPSTVSGMSPQTSIFDSSEAKAYLAQKLKKKTPEACKKTELIDLILKSGVDLAGRVPEEILNVKEKTR